MYINCVFLVVFRRLIYKLWVMPNSPTLSARRIRHVYINGVFRVVFCFLIYKLWVPPQGAKNNENKKLVRCILMTVLSGPPHSHKTSQIYSTCNSSATGDPGFVPCGEPYRFTLKSDGSPEVHINLPSKKPGFLDKSRAYGLIGSGKPPID